MKRTGAVLLVVLGSLALAGPASPQAAAGSETVTFTCPKEGVGIVDFLQGIEANTEANLLYDPSYPGVRAKLRWEGTVRVPKEKVFAWCRSVLFYHRLILVPVGPREGNLWSVLDVNSPQVAAHPEYVPVSELPEWKDRDGAYIVSVITLEHLEDTARARNALAQLSTRQVGRVNDLPSTRSFIVGDFAPVVHSMWVVLLKMDEAAANAPPPPAKKGVSRKPPTEKATATTELRRYEEMLRDCDTEVAARYFLSRLEELQAQAGKVVRERQ